MTDHSSTLANARLIHSEIKAFFANTDIIGGQRIAEWAAHFKIARPTPGFSPQECIIYGSKIMDLYHEASFHLSAAKGRLFLLKRRSASSTDLTVVDLVNNPPENRRLPNKEVILATAAVMNVDIDTAVILAELEVQFWKDTIDYLNTMRRLVETISLNLSVELKALQMDNITERIAQKTGEQNG